MTDHNEAYVAFDSSKLRHAVAIAEGGRTGEVRFLGEIENSEAATVKLVKKLASKASPKAKKAKKPASKKIAKRAVAKTSSAKKTVRGRGKPISKAHKKAPPKSAAGHKPRPGGGGRMRRSNN